MPSTNYIRIDTAEDAVSSLELAADFFERAVTDGRYWKWFVVATHAGIQGLFALALEAGNGLLVQKPGVMTAMLDAHKTGTNFPQPHMDNFIKLYKKLQQKENLRNSDSLALQASSVHELAVKSLDELRDNFLHFNTKSWSIERALIVESAVRCLEVAEFIISKSKSILWHESDHEWRVYAALERLQQMLDQQK